MKSAEFAQLRAVYEAACRVVQNSARDSFVQAFGELDTACEAVKLRDSRLADETINAASDAQMALLHSLEVEGIGLLRAVQCQCTLAERGSGHRTDCSKAEINDFLYVYDNALQKEQTPAVAAPDQEGLAEKLWACVPDIFTDSTACCIPARLIIQARDALRNSAKPAAEIPEGWQLVPKEPTDHMIDVSLLSRAVTAQFYKAMLERAPSPPSNNRSE